MFWLCLLPVGTSNFYDCSKKKKVYHMKVKIMLTKRGKYFDGTLVLEEEVYFSESCVIPCHFMIYDTSCANEYH